MGFQRITIISWHDALLWGRARALTELPSPVYRTHYSRRPCFPPHNARATCTHGWSTVFFSALRVRWRRWSIIVANGIRRLDRSTLSNNNYDRRTLYTHARRAHRVRRRRRRIYYMVVVPRAGDPTTMRHAAYIDIYAPITRDEYHFHGEEINVLLISAWFIHADGSVCRSHCAPRYA